MKITVVGATGMVGSRVVAEAARRGHEVVAVSRGGTPVEGAATAVAGDLYDTAALASLIDAGDVAVLTVPGPRDGHEDAVIDAHERLIASPPQRRVLVVGGAGSLRTPDGGRLKDTPDFPPEYKAEADAFTGVLEAYEAAPADGIDWVLLSPAPMLAPGERTGRYATADDTPAGDAISAEDLAVAIVDELEKPAHRRARFTVAN